MADAAHKSGLFPALRSPDAVMTLMLLCQAEGLHPIQALRRYDIIEGKPALKTDAMLADFMERGGRVKWATDNSHERCSANFSAPGLEAPVTVTWTVEDAKRAGLTGKKNWVGYTRQMLRARVVSEGIRLSMPSVVVGLYSPEEVADFDDRRPPQAAPPAQAEQHPAVAQVIQAFPAATTVADKPDIAPAPKGPTLATPNQVKALNIAIKALDLANLADGEGDPRLAWISGMLGRQVTSSKEMTSDEASKLIGAAKNGEMPQ
jgi:hypothetical protein